MKNKENILNNKALIIAIIFALVIILISIFTIAYSRYVQEENSNATGEVAKIICEMDIEQSDRVQTVVNPYCIVTVRDYNENNITETNVEYKIEVVAKDNIVLPEYYWKDEDGNVIARSVDVKDEDGNVVERTAEFPMHYFKNGEKAEKEFTIVFLNTGEEEILRLVDFNLIAAQSK